MNTEELCEEHEEKKRLLCFTDKTRICDDCVHFGKHKDHDIKPLKKVRHQLDTKKKQLEATLEVLDTHYAEVDAIINRARSSIDKAIKWRFEELRQSMKKKELELLYEANTFFDHQKQQIVSHIGNNSGIKQELVSKISDYQTFFQQQDLFRLIDENVEAVAAKFDSEALKMSLYHLESNFQESVNKFEESLLIQLQSLSQLSLPAPDLSKACSRYLKECKFETTLIKFQPKLQTKLKFLYSKGVLDILVQKDEASESAIVIEDSELEQVEKVVLHVKKSTLSERDAMAFMYAWRHIKKPCSFELLCESKYTTNEVLINVLSTICFIFNDIENFRLHLGGCKLINDESVLPFMERTLPTMKNLKGLNIWLYATAITDISFLAFAKNNTHVLNSLRRLELNLGNVKIKESSVIDSFVAMPNILSYYLNLKAIAITDKAIEVFVNRSLSSMKNLQSFELYLSQTKITDQHIPSLLGYVQNVKKFGFGLGSTEVTGKTLEILGRDYLPKMASLEDFDFPIYSLNLGDEELGHLWVPLKKIKRLTLLLDGNDITDKGLEELAERMLSSVEKLEHLEICLDETEITDEGALKLFTNVQNLKTFKAELSITKIGDRFGKEFLEVILPEMKALESFEIYLEDTQVSQEICDQIETVRRSMCHVFEKQDESVSEE